MLGAAMKKVTIVVIDDNIWFMSCCDLLQFKLLTRTAKMLTLKENAQTKSTQSTLTMESRLKYTAT